MKMTTMMMIVKMKMTKLKQALAEKTQELPCNFS